MDKSLIMAMFPLPLFFGFDHPKYLEVFIGLGDDRDAFTKMVGNCITLRDPIDSPKFKETVYSHLGYMGIDSDDVLFYATVLELIKYIHTKCASKIYAFQPIFVDAIEDSDWVNLFYHDASETTPCLQQQNVLTNIPGIQTTGL